jgi:hypothetical protein
MAYRQNASSPGVQDRPACITDSTAAAVAKTTVAAQPADTLDEEQTLPQDMG